MYANVRSLFQGPKSKILYSAAALVLAGGVFLATGHARNLLFASNGPAVMWSNQPPLPASEVAPLLALDKAMETVAARVTPSVVHIDVTSIATPTRGMQGQGQGQGDDGAQGMPDLPPPFNQFFRQYRGAPQQAPREERGVGSGVIVSPDGYIVTNNHVVNGAKSISVTLDNKQTYTAKLIGTDPDTDLAVIKINASGLESAPWGDSSLLKPGESVMAFGNPLDMDFTVTRGIVSAINRPRNQENGPDTRGEFIQTDAAINEGNSGGPLVNSLGQVIGINSEMLTNDGGYAGIGFAIPSDLVEPTAESLIKNGKVVRGYLGIQVTDVTPATAQGLDLAPSATGALIDQVDAGGPAAQAGLKQYDVITAVDGKPVTNGSELQMAVGEQAPGSTVHVSIVRNGQPQTVAATLGTVNAAGAVVAANGAPGSSSSPAAASASAVSLGITAAPLTDDVRSQLKLGAGVTGVVVQSVTPGGPADNAGIGAGDIIEQVNKKPVASVDSLQQQLDQAGSSKPVLLLVHNSSGDFILAVRPQAGGGGQ